MGLFDTIKALFGFALPKEKQKEPTDSIYPEESIVEEVHSVWDYIKINPQSQAFHICNVLGFEEWVPMNEILRRVQEMFGVSYQNERSLYPYIKTLLDCGFLESAGFAGKKHWRKTDLIIKIEEKNKKTRQTQTTSSIQKEQKQSEKY